jgi:exodeoxyribonuclease-3
MKIATFNINNVNKRLANLLEWLDAARPDVVCLQELKASDADFPAQAIERAGYGAVWRGEKSWNGVAILARGCEPIVTQTELPGDPQDRQSRYLEAAVNGVLITSLYAPNGNPQPGPKFDYKLAWLRRLKKHAAELLEAGVPVVLAGDYNIVPADQDIYPTKSYAKDALLQPQSRALYREIVEQGWTDAIRTLHPDARVYTFWDYMRNRWPRDAGLRIDHFLLSPDLAKRLTAAGVDREVRAKENASDHAPTWIVLKGAATKPSKPTSRVNKRVQSVGPKSKKKEAARARSRKGEPGRPLLIIDGDSFAHRSYHALPKSILGRDRKPAGAILGFANLLLRLYRTEQPRAVIVGWDTLDAPTYRHKSFPDYQSGREFEDALVEQLAVLPEFVEACGFVNAKGRGYEADDFLAAAAAAEERRGGTALVERVTILYPVRAGEMARIGPAEVRERYGVEPAQVPDFIALRGDASDRLPGMPGVGAKGAADVLRRYGSLEALLKAGRFPAHGERLRMFKAVATMDRRAPLPSLRAQSPTWSRAAEWAERWELKQLAKRLRELA